LQVLGLAVTGGGEAAAPGDAVPAAAAKGSGSSGGKDKPSKPQLYDYRVEVKKKHPKAVTLVRVGAYVRRGHRQSCQSLHS
jgi:hypothetical protein